MEPVQYAGRRRRHAVTTVSVLLLLSHTLLHAVSNVSALALVDHALSTLLALPRTTPTFLAMPRLKLDLPRLHPLAHTHTATATEITTASPCSATSTVNVALPALAAKCRAAAPCCGGYGCAAINLCYPQYTHCSGMRRPNNGTDKHPTVTQILIHTN